MNNNSVMRLAQRNKKDEFYTTYKDINSELKLYSKQFRDKIVFMPCDTNHSEFVRFMDAAYDCWGIKKFYALNYEPEGNATLLTEDAECLRFDEQKGDNGDFRTSETFRRLLEESDIITTNPPFSLFREFMKLLLQSGKKFCILGNMNQILTKDLLPYVTTGKMWFGPSIYSGDRAFMVPDDYPFNAAGTFVENGQKFIRVKGVRWFTNMLPDVQEEQRRFVPTVSIKDKHYDRFDYMPDIICVDRTQDIPCDYDGLMGVPLTYFDKHNPESFEIVDGVNRYLVLDSLGINEEAKRNKWHLLTVNGKVKYFRFLIRRKQSLTV